MYVAGGVGRAHLLREKDGGGGGGEVRRIRVTHKVEIHRFHQNGGGRAVWFFSSFSSSFLPVSSSVCSLFRLFPDFPGLMRDQAPLDTVAVLLVLLVAAEQSKRDDDDRTNKQTNK